MQNPRCTRWSRSRRCRAARAPRAERRRAASTTLPHRQRRRPRRRACATARRQEVKGVKPGESCRATQAQAVSDELMDEWQQEESGRELGGRGLRRRRAAAARSSPPPGPCRSQQSAASSATAQSQPARRSRRSRTGHTYGAFSDARRAAVERVDAGVRGRGQRDFPRRRSSSAAPSASRCDMCHPNAANTHPETYPKYQVQLGRVALLRDMINWCIENPVRGKPLARRRPQAARRIEAYILAQRKGVRSTTASTRNAVASAGRQQGWRCAPPLPFT